MGEVSDIVRGSSPRPISDSKWFDTNSKVGWLRISDVTSQQGRIKKLDQHLSKLGEEKTRVLLSPHLLLSIAASVGYPVINYVPTGVHDGFLIFKNPKFQLNYGFYWLQNNKNKWQKYGQPGSQVNLNSSIVENAKIFLPNNNEQSKIIALLLRIDKMLALQQQKNADIINLKKAILDKIFSNSNIQKWRDIRLNKVLSIPVDEPKEVTNIDDIISVKLNTQGISKIPNRSTLKLGSTKYYVRHGGQFIFGKQNFFNGSMAIIPSEYDGKVSSKDVPSLNINKDIVMPYFLWLYLSRPSFYKKTERWATGTGSKRLHIKDLLSLKIYIPNKNEQLRICNLMQSLDTQILKSQKHLKELQSIKKFLLQNMFI